jgi:hypothetical protein
LRSCRARLRQNCCRARARKRVLPCEALHAVGSRVSCAFADSGAPEKKTRPEKKLSRNPVWFHSAASCWGGGSLFIGCHISREGVVHRVPCLGAHGLVGKHHRRGVVTPATKINVSTCACRDDPEQ